MASRRRAPVYNPILTPAEEAAMKALTATATDVLARAKELVPRRTGRLQRSGKVTNRYLQSEVRFTAPHAWLQHEKVKYEHGDGRSAKYLERALEEKDLTSAIVSNIRAVFK